MSRIGKRPIPIPDKVTVTIEEQPQGYLITVKGPLGELKDLFTKAVTIKQEDGHIVVTRPDDEKRSRAMHGMTRTLIANMVKGVSEGFEKKMEIVGVGYRAAVQGDALALTLGFSHPVEVPIPQTITVAVEKNTQLTIKGIHPQHVGDLCAKIRSYRPPEPYKGKGIRFAGERIIRKAGKSGKK